jgi:hypothetical protein
MPFKHWEFWPYRWVYLPIIFYYCIQALRFRNPAWFSPVNSNMKYGGLFGYSKSEMLQSLPSKWVPPYFTIQRKEDFNSVLLKLQNSPFSFPIILKPEIGERGIGIEKINDTTELEVFLAHLKQDYIVQEFSSYSEEYGIFCIKQAKSNHFIISSLTYKEFLKVKGDGFSTVQQLLQQEARAAQYIPKIRVEMLNRIPHKNEDLLVQAIGNHNRGTLFRDGNHLISEGLIKRMNVLCNEIEGFRYGRFDIKTHSLAHLIEGKDSHIIELNGVASEPTHIYEPNNSWLNGQKELFRHWKFLVEITKEQKKLGVKFEPIILTFRDFFAYRRLIKKD